MMTGWGDFAAEASMARLDDGRWPAFTRADPVHYELGFSRGARHDFRDGRCEALIGLGLVSSASDE
jgi:hypothetical protein